MHGGCKKGPRAIERDGGDVRGGVLVSAGKACSVLQVGGKEVVNEVGKRRNKRKCRKMTYFNEDGALVRGGAVLKDRCEGCSHIAQARPDTKKSKKI